MCSAQVPMIGIQLEGKLMYPFAIVKDFYERVKWLQNDRKASCNGCRMSGYSQCVDVEYHWYTVLSVLRDLHNYELLKSAKVWF